jgi:hypothetical protein
MMSASEAANDDISGVKDARAPNFVDEARDLQNWASHCAKMATTKEQRYCKFFKVVKV